MDNNQNTTLEEKLIDVADVILIIMIGTALLATAFIFLVRGQHGNVITKNGKTSTSSPSGITTVIPEKPNPYKTISLEARAAYVYDVANKKILFEKNADQVLPLASLTKIMTALVAVDLLPPTSRITIDTEAMKTDGDTGLAVGETWSLKKLLDFTLVVSSNDGASAIAAAGTPSGETVQAQGDRTASFIDAMNAKARTIGLGTMHFDNETGLDTTDGRPGGVGSAKDVITLMEYVLTNSPQIMEATRHANLAISSETTVHYAANTNIVVRSIPGILASKTGFSDLAGGNLAIAYDAGLQQPIIIVVLGSTYDGRFSDMKALVRATQETIVGPTE